MDSNDEAPESISLNTLKSQALQRIHKEHEREKQLKHERKEKRRKLDALIKSQSKLDVEEIVKYEKHVIETAKPKKRKVPRLKDYARQRAVKNKYEMLVGDVERAEKASLMRRRIK